MRVGGGPKRNKHSCLADDIRHLCQDGGITQTALASAAGVPQPFISRMLDGTGRPTVETYARIASALGADLSVRLYPNTGPPIHDRHQARILEALLAILDPRWRPYVEVGVRRPSRGSIDVVLHDPQEAVLLATEIESALSRLEALVRWSQEKAESLPSWDGWLRLGPEPQVSRLLIVRRTRTNRQVARDFARQLAVAYQAHPDDVLASLTGRTRWPGAGLLWARLDGETRIIADR